MAVYTQRLGAVDASQGTSDTWRTLYTAPAGSSVVVRDVIWTSLGVPVFDVQVMISLKSRPGTYANLLQLKGFATSVYHLDCRQALETGDQILAWCKQGPWTCIVSGYVFA